MAEIKACFQNMLSGKTFCTTVEIKDDNKTKSAEKKAEKPQPEPVDEYVKEGKCRDIYIRFQMLNSLKNGGAGM